MYLELLVEQLKVNMFKKSSLLLSLVALLSCSSCSKQDTKYSNKNGSVSYEIFVREFYDSDNDGIGDFNGLTKKLDYLYDLGVKTLWLMPIHPSTSYHGYNVDDYYGVNSDFGTLNDFDNLVQKAKEKNIDIMLDMVFNHSGNHNIWFDLSYSDYLEGNFGENSYANFYNWSTSSRPNYHKKGDLYYEGVFDSSMPDLNLSNEKLKEQIEDVCRFWIEEHGVKGFRLDAVIHYFDENTKKNNEFLSWLNTTCKKYDPNFYMVGEAWTGEDFQLEYYKSGMESVFNFNSSLNSSSNTAILPVVKGFANGGSDNFGKAIEQYETTLKSYNQNGYSSYFLSNHDMDRASKNLGENINLYKLAASTYLLLPGTPFIYYGEEISLKGIRGSEPTDAARRLPMIWSKADKNGECNPPKGSPSYKQVELGVDDLLKDNNSLLNHYKKVINIRNRFDFMKKGIFKNLTSSLLSQSKKVLAYSISLNDDGAIFIHNYDLKSVEVKNIGGSLLESITLNNTNVTLSDSVITLPPQSSAIISIR